MTIALKYKIGSDTPVELEFDALVADDTPTTKRLAGRGLRQIAFAKRLAKWNSYTVIVSADQLRDAAKWGFIKAFWQDADRWWIALSKAGSPTPAWVYVESVLMKDGPMPVEYINGLRRLREVSFELEQLEATL